MAGEATDSVAERVRSACAWVAGRARFVQIEEKELPAYAAALPRAVEAHPPDPATDLVEADDEARAAFVLCLDAINFGSGWWPTIRKRPGRSAPRRSPPPYATLVIMSRASTAAASQL